ncbi:hypothetical protein AXG93_1502s1360 [Marchantia polymorpha subsp. ruderalis]|uniref:Uncharacterized protein n=1 Tax=Marchantia polymorpha subsp. ruderalis TaxID=1480154 RepID=A0A176WDP6_MARPO|nr:hypothetical protein AXG93_1502s1360 [Marchantia polymorpha subsp. ruderalis]
MVLIVDEEDDEKQVTPPPSSLKKEDGAKVKVVQREKDDLTGSSGGRGAADVGHDEDEDGWETASEGREDYEEASEGGDDENKSDSDSEMKTNVEGGIGIGESDPVPSTPKGSGCNEVLELGNKLSEVNVEEVNVEEVRKQGLEVANAAKAEGNALYGEKKFVEALQAYDRGLRASELKDFEEDPSVKEIRAILYSNRAACYIGLDNSDSAVKECSKALELNPAYMKALVRRAQAREKLTNYEEAMADWNKVLEVDPGNALARSALRTLGPLAEEKREKLKAEMLVV